MEQEGLKFYRCNTCGNMFMVMIDPDVIPSCCGVEMTIMHPESKQENREKHMPIIALNTANNCIDVRAGSVPHDSAPNHRIEWIALTDGDRVEIQKLNIGADPVAHFSIMDNKNTKLRAYAFCNIHGLWMGEK